MISHGSVVYVLGGYCDGKALSRIAKFTTKTWTDIGNLEQTRFGHRAITDSGRVYVVGGYNAYLYVFFLNRNFIEKYLNFKRRDFGKLMAK